MPRLILARRCVKLVGSAVTFIVVAERKRTGVSRNGKVKAIFLVRDNFVILFFFPFYLAKVSRNWCNPE